MKQTISDLRQVWLDAGYELQPYTTEEVEKAIQQFGSLPKVLIEYYTTIGAMNDEDMHEIRILAPSELELSSDGGEETREFLLYAAEIQYTDEFGILKEDLSQDNPVVYGKGESYYDLCEDDDQDFVRGDDEGIELEPEADIRTLMHSLWMCAYVAIEPEEMWTFEDED